MNFKIAALTPELAEQYLNAKEIAFDVETDTYDYHWESGDRGLSIAAGITHLSLAAFGLPPLVLEATPVDNVVYYETVENTYVVERSAFIRDWEFSEEEKAFIKALFSQDKTFIAHNLVFDARQVYLKFDIPIPKGATFYCTQTIALTGGWVGEAGGEEDDDSFLRGESLDLLSLSAHLLPSEFKAWWQQMKKQRGVLTRLLVDPVFAERRGVSAEDIKRYSAADSVVALALYEWQTQQPRFEAVDDPSRMVVQDSLAELIQIDLDYTKLCVEMAVKGIRLDVDYAKLQRAKYLEMQREALRALGLTEKQSDLPRGMKWRAEYIMSKLTQLPDEAAIRAYHLKTEKGAWSFAKEPMEYYLREYPELAPYRQWSAIDAKLRKIEEFLRHAEYDGRIHSCVARLAVTGRNTSSAPNIQNLQMKPKGELHGADLDIGLLIPDDDDLTFISLDCSNAENWMGAMYSRDDDFARACASEDFHSQMAAAYFPDYAQQDSSQKKILRNLGKAITFGTAYGMGQEKLARTLGVSLDEARTFLEAKDRTFPKVARAKSAWSSFAEENGYAILWTGRRVKMRRYAGKYKGYTAWNSLAQGGVGELIVRGMLRVSGLCHGRNRVVSQIHDELIIQVDKADYADLVPRIIEALSTVVPERWNNRTTPACRWLFDLCNRSNKVKWGWRHNQEYALPDEYVNRWGRHAYPSDSVTECPVWINRHGYGAAALAKEIGEEPPPPPPPPEKIVVLEPFNWDGLRKAVLAGAELFTPFSIDGRVFSFAEGVELLRSLAHRGLDDGGRYKRLCEQLDDLSDMLDRYRNWRQRNTI